MEFLNISVSIIGGLMTIIGGLYAFWQWVEPKIPRSPAPQPYATPPIELPTKTTSGVMGCIFTFIGAFLGAFYGGIIVGIISLVIMGDNGATSGCLLGMIVGGFLGAIVLTIVDK